VNFQRPLARTLVTARSTPFFIDLGVAACALALFFLLKDLGPALVTGFLFLTMFAVARGRAVTR